MRLFSKRRSPPGSPPGTLVETPSKPAKIRVFSYNNDELEQRELESVDELVLLDELCSEDRVVWLDIEGIGDLVLLRALGARFDLHPLLLEDIVNVPQRPKVDDYRGTLLAVTRMLRFEPENGLDAEQVSLVLRGNVLVTFQERSGDVFDPVRKRIAAATGRIRTMGADYLLYALIDAVVDAYYPVIEGIGDELEDLEDAVMTNPTPVVLRRITALKSDLLSMRRAVWPQRESVLRLSRGEVELVSADLAVFFRDIYDHAIQAGEVLESYRELASGLLNTYLTVVANKTNDIMKVLTIIASIFIPLTFLAGIYGMNFDYMPELKFDWGYPALITVMIVIGLGSAAWFRRRGWL